ncbi:MAG: alpha/beta fold hydrolase [Amnibacterium sp.]
MPTVLVHGIGVARLYYERLADVLARSGPVLTLELPGFGGAPKRPDRRHPPTVEEHALLVAALLRDHGASAYRVVGHSMGTQIAADLAARDPELVQELALLGPVTDPAAPDALRQGLRLARDTLGESLPANVAVFTDYARTGPRWYLRTLPFMLGYDLRAVLPRVAAPTLVLRGAGDPIAPGPWTQQVAALLPRSRFVEVPGAHHVVQFTHPCAVTAELAAGVP